MTKRSKHWLGGLALFFALIALGIYFFDWNMLRGPIARQVERSTGRTFAINGDLHVHLSLRPRITADGVVLGNASWARDPNMADIGRLDFTIDALPLLRGKTIFEQISLSEVRISLEKNKDGTPNWQFDNSNQKRDPPIIHALSIDRGRIAYLDPTLKTDLTTDVATVPADQPNAGMLKIDARGRVKGFAGTVDGFVGSVLALSSVDKPYPIKLKAVVGNTKARADGTLLDPMNLKSEDLNFELEGSDLAQLYPIIGVPLPPTPAYKLTGHLNHTGGDWSFRKFAGQVGRSDLSGDFSVDVAQKPQYIKADLVSRNLDMKDLGGLVGGDRGESKSSPKPPPADRVLPQEPFNLEKLRVANADVKFRGENILTKKLPLEKLVATLKLRDGVLTLEPLNFGVAGGNLVSQIRMDARQPVIKSKADIAVKQLHLEKLFPTFKLNKANAGVITGRAKLDMTGNSVAKMLGQADGETALLMDGGSVSELLVRLLNLDVANAIPVLLTGDRQLPVRCMVTHLKGEKGDFKVQTLVLDTGKAVVTGSGSINFAEETIDLTLAAKSKTLSLAALRGPIHITGTFKNPKVAPDIPRALARGAAAVGLGVVTGGIGALLPLIDLGGAKDTNCAALIEEVTSSPQLRMQSAKR
ncbi:MAG: AsmA family protein [Burkholderiales bacterium]